MKIKELSFVGGSFNVVFDVGDDTTIKHRTQLTELPALRHIYLALCEAEKIAERMVSERALPPPQKLPQSLKSVIDGPDFYNDPEYTVGPGPITPHALLDAGD